MVTLKPGHEINALPIAQSTAHRFSTQARRLVFAWAGSFSLKTDR